MKYRLSISYIFNGLFRSRKQKESKKKEIDWEKGYYIGQEYVEDEKIHVLIEANFFSPGPVASFSFYLNGNKISVSQTSVVLTLSIERKISEVLFKDLIEKKSKHFILAYIARVLPRINQEILSQKYARAHILMRTFSMYDIVALMVKSSKHSVGLEWPQVTSDFPFKADFQNDTIYMRDYMDAIDSYFRADYNDCVRKIITCVENFFNHHKIQGDGFKNKIKENIPEEKIGPRVIRGNLLFIYKIRNRIVHSNFRIKFSNGWFAKKAIGTVQYLLQSPLNKSGEGVEIIHGLVTQFLMLNDYYGGRSIYDLDDIEWRKNNEYKHEPKFVNTMEDMNEFAFQGLEISTDEKSIIYKK
ncbi:MAG: hypothetical protein K9M11_02535 [Candidatus Pacebacteria bacterium]|nr:hypothetical protein [Candidatus Paceibacterota bacterium]